MPTTTKKNIITKDELELINLIVERKKKKKKTNRNRNRADATDNNVVDMR